MVLTAQNLDGSNPFRRRTRLPEGKVFTRRGISERPLLYRLLNHATMIPLAGCNFTNFDPIQRIGSSSCRFGSDHRLGVPPSGF